MERLQRLSLFFYSGGKFCGKKILQKGLFSPSSPHLTLPVHIFMMQDIPHGLPPTCILSSSLFVIPVKQPEKDKKYLFLGYDLYQQLLHQ